MPDCEPLVLPEAWLLLAAWLVLLEAAWLVLLEADGLAVLDEGWFAEALCAIGVWVAEEAWACLSLSLPANAVLIDRASAVSASF
jgi:hypothetical protein